MGATVSVRDYAGVGTLLFFGKHLDKGKLRCGIAMKEAVGKNNGTVGGHQYFECEVCQMFERSAADAGVAEQFTALATC